MDAWSWRMLCINTVLQQVILWCTTHKTTVEPRGRESMEALEKNFYLNVRNFWLRLYLTIKPRSLSEMTILYRSGILVSHLYRSWACKQSRAFYQVNFSRQNIVNRKDEVGLVIRFSGVQRIHLQMGIWRLWWWSNMAFRLADTVHFNE